MYLFRFLNVIPQLRNGSESRHDLCLASTMVFHYKILMADKD